MKFTSKQQRQITRMVTAVCNIVVHVGRAIKGDTWVTQEQAADEVKTFCDAISDFEEASNAD